MDVRDIIQESKQHVEEFAGTIGVMGRHVRSVGNKRVVIMKKKCPQGMRFNRKTGGCAQMSSETKLHLKVGARKAVRTFKAEGSGAALRKRIVLLRTLKVRKSALGAI